MKKALSVILAAALLLSCSLSGFAAESPVLRFDENGEFKILHLCDCQDDFPAHGKMIQFIEHVIEKYDPDLVVLGGDNTTGSGDTKAEAIEELVKPFVESGTYFTLVFGNHDREQGVDNAELLRLYQEKGGKYCLAYNADPTIHGVGNHNLPIFASDSLKVAYNLYMFDTGTSGYFDANGNGGYECAYEDQVKWFENVNNTYTALNGGKIVPSMVFQHIIVGEVMEALYKEVDEVPFSLDSKFVNGKEYDLVFADMSVIKSGILFEPPCPGVEDSRQFEAMVEQGVVATFSGHDHINSFTINYKGVDIVNTPGTTFESYGNDMLRGARLITLYEGETEYGSELITVSQEVLDGADIDHSVFASFFGVMLNKVITFFMDLLF